MNAVHLTLHMYSTASGVGEPPPQQPYKIQRIALLNWKNGTKTLFWQEEVDRLRRWEAEVNYEDDRGRLYVVWCVGNAFTCKVKPDVIRSILVSCVLILLQGKFVILTQYLYPVNERMRTNLK